MVFANRFCLTTASHNTPNPLPQKEGRTRPGWGWLPKAISCQYCQDSLPLPSWPERKRQNWVLPTTTNDVSRNSLNIQTISSLFQFLKDMFSNSIHEIFQTRQVISVSLQTCQIWMLNPQENLPRSYWHLFIPSNCFNFKELTPSREKPILPENSQPNPRLTWKVSRSSFPWGIVLLMLDINFHVWRCQVKPVKKVHRGLPSTHHCRAPRLHPTPERCVGDIEFVAPPQKEPHFRKHSICTS